MRFESPGNQLGLPHPSAYALMENLFQFVSPPGGAVQSDVVFPICM